MTSVVIPRTDTILALVRRCLDEGWDTSSTRPILADALEEQDFLDVKTLVNLRSGGHLNDDPFIAMLTDHRLVGYDWGASFAYAGEPGDWDGEASVKPAHPGRDVDCRPFSRWDVDEVVALDEGEGDVKNWLCFGKLRDGRWFFLTAGCDYTGWG